MQRPSRIVGILGGMGPDATVDFYAKLVRATPASRDQEHLRVVIWADPTVPSRQDALLSGGEDPGPWLEAGVQHLISCGAEILVVPCNTVHAFLPAVVAGKDVEFLSIIDVTVDAVLAAHATGGVGLLATNGALASGLYQAALQAAGLQVVLPADSSQRAIAQVIHTVKAGEDKERARQTLTSLLTELQNQGVSTVIAGCTELSVLLGDMNMAVRVIDPSEALARKAVERARSNLTLPPRNASARRPHLR